MPFAGTSDTSGALLIGSDCPALTARHLRDAARALASGNDAVLVPVEDGGYALIGLTRCDPRVFEGVSWGTSSVLEQTRERLASNRLALGRAGNAVGCRYGRRLRAAGSIRATGCWSSRAEAAPPAQFGDTGQLLIRNPPLPDGPKGAALAFGPGFAARGTRHTFVCCETCSHVNRLGTDIRGETQADFVAFSRYLGKNTPSFAARLPAQNRSSPPRHPLLQDNPCMSDLSSVSTLRGEFFASFRCRGTSTAAYTTSRNACFSTAVPGYVGHELMVPNVGDYYVARMDRQRKRARPKRQRSRAFVEHLPAPSGGDAPGARKRTKHRLPPPSLDLRAGREAPRRASFSAESVPRPRANRSSLPGTDCCSRASATSRQDLARLGVAAELDFSGFMFDRVVDRRIRVQLEDVHRGLSRGLSRRALPSGARQLRRRRRPPLGVRRLVQRADMRRAGAGSSKPGSETVQALARRSAAPRRRPVSPRTARSGSPISPTSWSSGIRTRWW